MQERKRTLREGFRKEFILNLCPCCLRRCVWQRPEAQGTGLRPRFLRKEHRAGMVPEPRVGPLGGPTAPQAQVPVSPVARQNPQIPSFLTLRIWTRPHPQELLQQSPWPTLPTTNTKAWIPRCAQPEAQDLPSPAPVTGPEPRDSPQ